MLTGSLRICGEPLQAAHKAADAFLLALEQHDTAKDGLFNVALSGGSTPNAIYDYLAQLPAERNVRALAAKARYFWSDERTVPPEHADSNFGQAWNRWLKNLALPADQIHRLPGEQPPDAAAEPYQRLIETNVPVSAVPPDGRMLPRFDLIFLGMGPDGHTASLFPGTAALQETKRLVVANAVPQHNTTRLTFTFPLINAAKQVWILCTGESKADALAAVGRAGVKGDSAYPISQVQPTPGSHLTWWLDRTATAKLAV